MTIERRRVVRIVGSVVSGLVMTVIGTISFSLAATQDFPHNPLAAYALPDGERIRFEGRVLERIDAGSYVYLSVERTSGDRVWVVTLASSRGAAAGVGAVSVLAIGHADRFDSRRLSRSFDDLYFGVVRPT